MNSSIFLLFVTVGLLIVVKSDDVAISNRLSRKLCNNFENSQYGRVVPDASQSLPICPVFEKEESRSEWVFNKCGDNNNGDKQPSGKVRGLNKPKGEGGGGGEDYDERIRYGREPPPFSHPYIVFFRTEEVSGHSGVIYNRYTIIVHTYHLSQMVNKTKQMDFILIHIGKHINEQRENEVQIRFFCNFTHMPKTGVSLVHLYEPITINNYADKIRLAKPSQTSSIGKNCVVPGWGDEVNESERSPRTILEADAMVKDCIDKAQIPETNLCTNPVYCYGDSGSPLICTDKHRIFASGMAIAVGRNSSIGCKRSKETVYNDFKIQSVHDWLEKTYQATEGMCRPLLRPQLF